MGHLFLRIYSKMHLNIIISKNEFPRFMCRFEKEYINCTVVQITIQKMTLQNIEKLSFVENNASN